MKTLRICAAVLIVAGGAAVASFIRGVTVASARQSNGASVRRLDGSTITAAQIDETVTRLLAEGKVTGVGLAILEEGKIAYLRAYGIRDKERNLALTTD